MVTGNNCYSMSSKVSCLEEFFLMDNFNYQLYLALLEKIESLQILELTFFIV